MLLPWPPRGWPAACLPWAAAAAPPAAGTHCWPALHAADAVPPRIAGRHGPPRGHLEGTCGAAADRAAHRRACGEMGGTSGGQKVFFFISVQKLPQLSCTLFQAAAHAPGGLKHTGQRVCTAVLAVRVAGERIGRRGAGDAQSAQRAAPPGAAHRAAVTERCGAESPAKCAQCSKNIDRKAGRALLGAMAAAVASRCVGGSGG